jgi:hypothetical protein
MEKVTICLTNWKRPQNVNLIIDKLKKQKITTTIFLWNNGSSFFHRKLDWIVESSINKYCLPRWYMASYAITDYVCILDDDLIFSDDYILSDLIKLHEQENSSSIIGASGVILDPGNDYFSGRHVYAYKSKEQHNTRCDIIKGTLMLMRTEELKEKAEISKCTDDIADDIFISYQMSAGRKKHHLCATSYEGRFKSLGDDRYALWKKADHFRRRNDLVDKLFNVHQSGTSNIP